MSKGPSPTAIGAFVLTGLLLAIGAAIYFGSVSISSGDPQFVMCFDESVAGLAEGAKVKLRGVPIGVVKRIVLRLPNQADHDPRIPVFVEIHTGALRRLGALTQVTLKDSKKSLERAIERGLRGRLQMESLITGLYYIELDFETNPGPPVYGQDPERIEYQEIPTVPSQFAAIGRTASDMATQVATIPFNELSRHLLSLVKSIDLILADLLERQFVQTIADTMESVRTQVKGVDLVTTVEELTKTLHSLNQVLEETEGKIDPIIAEVHAVAADLKGALQSIRDGIQTVSRVGKQIDDALAPSSTLRYQAEKALTELAEAANSIGRLADQQERNPGAIVRGTKKKVSIP